MKSVALVHTHESPCLHTHHPACMEFLNGFTDYGYNVSCATTLAACKDKDILLLSSHAINFDFLNKLNALNPNAVYILWFYHSLIDKLPFKKFIITSEYYHYTPRGEFHRGIDAINKSINNHVPLMFMADESPEKIGTYTKTYTLDGCFMGTSYKPDWVEGLPNILFHTTSSGLLSYDERRKNHLRSKIAFGFTSDQNVLNYHPTQRVFEGLAYGCVVISDNEAARDLTGGIVEYAASKDEFLKKYNYYLTHPEECKQKELAGYEWARKHGTNRHAVALFLTKIRELGF